ncbi:MAG: HNH endonuclease, partial [Proteobacteria bacterium]|nr:HNH endonuclease [Pseudomonadota bacterium]
KKLAWKNYGLDGQRGSWHIDHSKPKSKGGTDYLRNLVPACIDCNREKSNSQGSYYKQQFEPDTIGGWLVENLGLPKGFLGASRRKRRI